jgi:acylglycerol lipase
MNLVSRQNGSALRRRRSWMSPGKALRGRVSVFVRGHAATRPLRLTDGVFVMPDGALLPYREWLPPCEPAAVVLALHGINDSADAWEIPSGLFVDAGIAVIAPDQRGFGAASGREKWHGTEVMVKDALAMMAQTRARFPRARLYLAGESMGAAVLMVLAAAHKQLKVDGYIFSAPAVWGRREMAVGYRLSLWLAHKTVPWMRLSATALGLRPSNNEAALRAVAGPGLARRSARIDCLKGLADLMDSALEAAGRNNARALFLYGGKDQLVPQRAMAACWKIEQKTNARNRVFAFYPGGFHLLQRDVAGAVVTRDIVHWLLDSRVPLPSGAEARAADWLENLAA